MIARRTVQVIRVSRCAGKPGQTDLRQPRLRQTWSIDPATGKLVARWVVEHTETTRTVALSPAA